jgi:5'-nucleotidase
MQHKLPAYTLLNVNVPCLAENEIKGIRISRQGLRIYRDVLVAREDPRGRPYYWIGGEPPTGVAESGTDFGDLHEGFISITPIHLDMTAHSLIEELKGWNWPV